MVTNILKIKSLTKSYTRKIKNSSGDDENERYWVIKDLDLEVQQGLITAIIGGNGAGKTSLFNIISGFTKPDCGSVILSTNNRSVNLVGLPPIEITRYSIGRLFQEAHIFKSLSVLDNMLIADNDEKDETILSSIFLRGKVNLKEKKRIEKVHQVFLDLFRENNQLWSKREMVAGNLSYGEQRLLGLARLFMRKYDILLLDEPTAGVNPDVIEKIEQIIKKISLNGQTVLIIEHNINVVLNIADVCCFMDRGSIKLYGNPQEVINNELVRLTYSGL